MRAMPASDLFADLLAAKLQEEPETGRFTPDAVRTGPFEPMADLGGYRRAQVGARAPGAPAYVELGTSPPARPRSTTTASELSPAQHDALTALRRLGAPLTDRFDAYQLKTAFRRLALELHPDRHPGANSERRACLGTRFAVLCEAYRTLNEPLRS